MKKLVAILVLGAMAGGGYWVVRSHQLKQDKAQQPQQEESVPASVAVAETQDFPVYLDSLGEVRAWNMVTVRSRVDGEILKIAFEEGQFVKEGDLLVQIDPRPFQAVLDQALAKKRQDEVTLANARRDLQRYEKVGTLAASQQQIDTQRSLVAQQEALLKADKGAIDNARVQLGYTTIRAPISGRVGFRLVDQGNIVHTDDTGGIATIAQIQPIAVIFTEPEEELPRILEKLKKGPLKVIAFTSDSKRELGKGELSLVNNKVDQATGSIKLKAKFANEKRLLWPGLSVATRLLIATEKNVVVVPDAAVQRGPDGLFAYVVGANNKIELRKLDVGEIQNGKAVVRRGVRSGERVVTSGYYRLKPGSTVAPPADSQQGVGQTTALGAAAARRAGSPEVE